MTALCPEFWLLLQSGAGDSAFNMAQDEAMLEAVSRLGQPLLRFYGWREAAATFGYFQKYAEVQRWTSLRPLIRRPTGGGLVPHDADWTYSLAFPPCHSWYRLRGAEGYRRLHEWLQAAFASLGVPTQLSALRRPHAVGQCFVGAEQHDLVWQQRKIAGAAQRRSRLGLLIQGSVQPPPDLARSRWEQAMLGAASEQWRITWQACDADASLTTRAKELAAQKYSQAAYNQRR